MRKSVHILDVHASQHHHPRIARQTLVQEVLSHVNCVDHAAPTLEQAIREATGGRSEIDSDDVAHIQLERIQSVVELLAPTRDETRWLHDQQLIGAGDHSLWIACDRAVDEHEIQPDQSSRLIDIRNEPAVDEDSLEFGPLHPRRISSTTSARESRSSVTETLP